MVPDHKSLRRPVLELAATGEVRISDAVQLIADQLDLSPEDRAEMLPSGKQTRFANRIHWARSYLKQAGLLENPRRGSFRITDRGRTVLRDVDGPISDDVLNRFKEFRSFVDARGVRPRDEDNVVADSDRASEQTPDEVIREAHREISAALADDLLEKLRESEPAFFEDVIIQLLLAMGYGHGEESGRVLGGAGDDGVDGVINLDPLGVDQVYVQAKRYASGNTVGSGELRDFFGALAMKDVQKGIFLTTSRFSPSAQRTAEKLSARIVMIDGPQIARLMIAHQIGCRVTETFPISRIDESFFE